MARDKTTWFLVAVVIVPPPAKRQINNLSRSRGRIKHPEGFENHRPLLLDVARLTERVTEGPLDVDGSRRLHLFRIFTHDRHPDSRDAGFFNLSLDQSHGLVADASGRGQQDHVDGLLPELFDDLSRRLVYQGGDVMPVNVPHEGVVAGSQFTDDAFFL